MIGKYPALLCNLLLLLGFLSIGPTMQAQLDFEVAKTIVGFDPSTKTTSEISVVEAALLFSENGQGKLVNGRAEIKIDPEIANQIDGLRIEEMITVSIQLEGNSNGVYISKKDKNTFVITELENGISNAPFSYQFIVKDPK